MKTTDHERNLALARRVLSRAPVVRLATMRDDGAPLLRTVHAVVIDDYIAFHGAPRGEKAAAVGRLVSIGAEQIVASIPSTFFDPRRACPATTYFISAQTTGSLELVDSLDFKARVLTALMKKHQPEGGYEAIGPAQPLYRKSVAGVLIARVSLAALVGKVKLGQRLRPERRRAIVEKLWARGDRGDPAAIDTIVQHTSADCAPAFLQAKGCLLRCSLPDEMAEAAAALVRDEYWNAGVPLRSIVEAHRCSLAWVGATDLSGALIATARAIGDVAKHAYILDVAVHPAWRKKGIGSALMRLLLDHPALRRATRVWLRTKDAQPFYARFGFDSHHAHGSTEMLLQRASRARSSS